MQFLLFYLFILGDLSWLGIYLYLFTIFGAPFPKIGHFAVNMDNIACSILETQGRYWQWDGNLTQEAKTILHQVSRSRRHSPSGLVEDILYQVKIAHGKYLAYFMKMFTTFHPIFVVSPFCFLRPITTIKEGSCARERQRLVQHCYISK